MSNRCSDRIILPVTPIASHIFGVIVVTSRIIHFFQRANQFIWGFGSELMNGHQVLVLDLHGALAKVARVCSSSCRHFARPLDFPRQISGCQTMPDVSDMDTRTIRFSSQELFDLLFIEFHQSS
jgi:hypothetical protein